MSENARPPLPWKGFLFLFFAAYFAISVWNDSLSGNDEPRVAGIAREMALSGEYGLPRLNGESFHEYPSLGYIPYALLFSVLDEPPEFLAHLIPALFGLATLYFVYRLGAILGGMGTGVASALALALCVGFANVFSRVLVDPILTFFITASLWGFLSMRERGRGEISWAWLAFYGGMGAGVLTKGLIGAALPGLIAAVDLVVRRDPGSWKKLRPASGLLVMLGIISLWALPVAHENGWAFLAQFVTQSVWRFASPQADHALPFHHYLLPLTYVLLPGSVVFLAMAWQRWKRRDPWRNALTLEGAERFPAIWFLAGFVALSCASAKRNLYLVPLFPGFALWAGILWTRLQRRYAMGGRALQIALTAGLLCFAAIEIFVILPNDRDESWRPPVQHLAENAPEEGILLFQPSESLRGAVVFYLGRTVPVAYDAEELRTKIEQQSGPTRVVTLHDGIGNVRRALPPEAIREVTPWKVGRRDVVIFRVAAGEETR